MKVLFISSHVYSRSTRKTSVHYLADDFVRREASVCFATVGHSLLKNMFKPSRSYSPKDNDSGILLKKSFRVFEPVQPSNSKSDLINLASTFLFGFYGKIFDKNLAEEARAAELIVLEGGHAICYLKSLKKLNRAAEFWCLMNDRLGVVGFSRRHVEKCHSNLRYFDLVRVPAIEIADGFPAGTRTVVAGQGVMKEEFDKSNVSPYDPGTQNIIVIGDMLFDRTAVEELARLLPQVNIHLFGKKVIAIGHNIICHGEKGFIETVPFVKFADVGIAPYVTSLGAAYVSSSSLKLAQYRYCGLPVLLPEAFSVGEFGDFTYQRDLSDLHSAAVKALSRGRVAYPRPGESWEEVLDKIMSSSRFKKLR